MNVVCLDLEGVLVPEIWIAFTRRRASQSSSEPHATSPTDKLMNYRLAILDERRLAPEIAGDHRPRSSPGGHRPLLDALSRRAQVDHQDLRTFSQSAAPHERLGMAGAVLQRFSITDTVASPATSLRSRCERNEAGTTGAPCSNGSRHHRGGRLAQRPRHDKELESRLSSRAPDIKADKPRRARLRRLRGSARRHQVGAVDAPTRNLPQNKRAASLNRLPFLASKKWKAVHIGKRPSSHARKAICPTSANSRAPRNGHDAQKRSSAHPSRRLRCARARVRTSFDNGYDACERVRFIRSCSMSSDVRRRPRHGIGARGDGRGDGGVGVPAAGHDAQMRISFAHLGDDLRGHLAGGDVHNAGPGFDLCRITSLSS